MPVLVINMLSASERRRASRERLRLLGLSGKFVHAIDGAALPDGARGAYSPALNRRAFKRPLTPGEIGCYLSHYEAWKIIAAGSRPVLVLEDDFVADARLPEVLDRLLATDLPDAVIKLDATKPRARIIRTLGTDHALVDPWVTPPRTTGYVMTPRVARIMVGSALPFGRPVDMDLKHWWELGVRVLAVSPGLIGEAEDARSQIDDARSAVRNGLSRFERFGRNLRYQSRFHINLLCARNGIGPLHRGTGLALRSALPS